MLPKFCRELIQAMSTVPQHAPLSIGNPFTLATVESVTYVCPARCPAPQPTVRHLPEQVLLVCLPQCASASLEQVPSLYLEQEEVLLPDRLEAPTCACGLKLTRVWRRALSSLSDCLLLDVKRLPEGPATALEAFEHLIVAGLKLQLSAAITRHGQHFMAHVRQGRVITTYDDTRVSQTPAWPTSVFLIAPSSCCAVSQQFRLRQAQLSCARGLWQKTRRICWHFSRLKDPWIACSFCRIYPCSLRPRGRPRSASTSIARGHPHSAV